MRISINAIHKKIQAKTCQKEQSRENHRRQSCREVTGKETFQRCTQEPNLHDEEKND
jgi:hypothetical protein